MKPIDPRARATFRSDKLAKENLFDSPRMFVDVWGLEPGQSQQPHLHADADKVYQALQGRGVVTIGDAEHPLEEGAVAVCPAGRLHGVRNEGPERLVLLVMMTRGG